MLLLNEAKHSTMQINSIVNLLKVLKAFRLDKASKFLKPMRAHSHFLYDRQDADKCFQFPYQTFTYIWSPRLIP